MPIHILAIDDNVLNQRLIGKILTRAGYSVQLAYSGSQGVQVARQIRPDLILLDIGLPGMNGFHVLQTLRLHRITQRIPVVAVTGYAMHGDRERCLEAGFNGYIAKPVMRSELLSTVKDVLERRKLGDSEQELS